MKKIIALLMCVVLLYSCGNHMKKIHEDSSTVSNENVNKVNSIYDLIDTSKYNEWNKSKSIITDTGYLITNEKIDTNLVIKGGSVSDTLHPNSDTGDIITNNVNKDGINLKTQYNKKTNTFIANATKDDEEKHLLIDKTTFEKKGITTENNNDIHTEVVDGVKVSKNDSSLNVVKHSEEDKHKDESIHHNYSIMTIVIGLVAVLIVIIGLYWFFGKPKK